MDLKKLINTLHPLERRVLPFLDKYSYLNDLVNITGLKEVEVMRALQWLQNKNIIKLSEESKEVINIDENGRKYIKEGLPEIKLLKSLKKSDLTLNQAKDRANLSKDELNICLGVLRKKAAIFITKDKDIIIKLMDQGRKILDNGSLEEIFLKNQFPIELKLLKEEERFAFEELKSRRKILKLDLVKIKRAELTDTGKKILEAGIDVGNILDRLTSAMLRDSSWKEKEFRRYDIKINVPSVFGGRKQHYRRFLDEVRQKFLALGFTEMFGPIVETNFWDMDALFMPQFHSARDIHSAYHIKDPKFAKDLPKDLVDKVKKAHENGFGTGSKGWQYEFDVKLTAQHLLRTQGTALSARMLASDQLKIPGKYFAIARCFRPDVVDATHLADFNQVEGIIAEEGLNMRHLFGLLKLFAKEFANTTEIKITPAYFPFTEPSATLYAKHPEMGWIELGGSGIFRPEMTKPLGINVPVLAWGIGIDRLAMFKLGIKDIRELFSHDLGFLKKEKMV
ncbi:MAG: phenylalanine--tRNA ligase subunit alpha [Candidatus Woesearchaeota archaeon]|nr:phenylalanine--tRNA ligase subunit alpha [Candidatus Woesearchaeota archaeon]